MTFSRMLNAFILISVTLILTSSLASVSSLYMEGRLNNQVNRSQKALIELNTIATSITEAETSVRGFLVTRDSLLLEPYSGAIEKTYVSLRKTKILLDNREEALRVLKTQLNQRVQIFNRGLHYKQLDRNTSVALFREGNLRMKEVRKSIEALKSDQVLQLSDNQISVNWYSKLSKILVIGASIIATIFIFLYHVRLKNSYFNNGRQKAIINAMPGNIAIIDKEGIITSVNERWRNFAKRNNYQHHDSGVGENYIKICEKSADIKAKGLAEGIKKVIKGEAGSYSIDYPYSSPGEERWFKAVIAPIEGRDLPEYVIIHFDVTETKMTEKELARINERFSLIMKATRDVIWDWNLATGERYMSKIFSKKHGITAMDNTTSIEAWITNIHEEDRERVVSSVHNALNNPSVINWSERYLFKKADGSFAQVKDDGYILRDEQGKATRMVGAMQDRTHLNHQKQRIQEQKQRLREIAFMNSHELRKPLANILGLVEVMEAAEVLEIPELISLLKNSSTELDQKVKAIATLTNKTKMG